MTTTTPPRPLARASPRASPARGTTLPELLVAVTVAGLLAAIAIRGAARIVDEARARGAAADVRTALALARRVAILRAERAAVRLDSTRASVAVHVRGDTLLSRALGRLHGVRLAATRESTAYGGDGLGFGAANLRVIVRRGAAAETVTVSRAGRVR
jgi:prepilin-type N-terminal cleavage/methylation domain-containing protein